MINNQIIHTNCCIVGGGPAGIILGYLLAKAGVEVLVLEKHPDFFRDFRGDTVHPSTLKLINQMGLLDEFLELPHEKVSKFKAIISNPNKDKLNEINEILVADFSRLNTIAPYIAMIPQWDFLNFFTEKAKLFKNFKILMNTEAYGFDKAVHMKSHKNSTITEPNINIDKTIDKTTDKILLAKNKTNNSNLTIKSNLIIACDGRHSTLRDLNKFTPTEYGAPIDVLWFRVSKLSSDPNITGLRFQPGRIMVMINRQTYWQCAYVIPKNGFESLKQHGLDNLKQDLINICPFIQNRLPELKNWDDIKLLNVQVNYLNKWYDEKLLFIGDSAHAMSPIGGVGINLAIQDAVAAYKILKTPLLENNVTLKHLKQVQQKRQFAVKLIQKMQVNIHKNLIYKNLTDVNIDKNYIPLPFRIINKFKFLTKYTAYFIGIGPRPEYID